MKFKKLIEYLDEIYPKNLSMAGDSDGVDVCADYDIEIGGVLLAVDITLGTIEFAKTHGYNCILSHHTMIFEPLNKLDANSGIAAKKAAMLARNDICAASFHTRLDGVSGGVNDCFLDAVGIRNAEPLICADVPIGRTCTFDKPIGVAELAGTVDKSLKQFFREHFTFELKGCVKYSDSGEKIKKLAVVAGSGMSFIEYAAYAGADTFLTGEGKFYSILEAREAHNMSVITAGHFETEATVLPELKRAVLAEFPKTRIDYFIDDYAGLI
jgi:dinuclear metal center YbgI/SA1388 family protein